jgi:hypothetical protein
MSLLGLPPGVAGLPPLFAAPGAVSGLVNTTALLVADAVSLFGALQAPWGIYFNSKPIALADSVISLRYRQDWRISDYPLEQGAFQSYNKVEMPYDVLIKLAKGGSQADRYAFLSAIDAAAQSLNLYDVLTPERIFSSVNIAHVEYERTADHGKTLITVEIGLIEIRSTATLAFTDTLQSSGADPQNVGLVQPGSSISEPAGLQ